MLYIGELVSSSLKRAATKTREYPPKSQRTRPSDQLGVELEILDCPGPGSLMKAVESVETGIRFWHFASEPYIYLKTPYVLRFWVVCFKPYYERSYGQSRITSESHIEIYQLSNGT